MRRHSHVIHVVQCTLHGLAVHKHCVHSVPRGYRVHGVSCYPCSVVGEMKPVWHRPGYWGGRTKRRMFMLKLHSFWDQAQASDFSPVGILWKSIFFTRPISIGIVFSSVFRVLREFAWLKIKYWRHARIRQDLMSFVDCFDFVRWNV